MRPSASWRELALAALVMALVAVAFFPQVLLGGGLLAGPSYLDKTLAVWRALAAADGLGWLPDAQLGYPFALAPDQAVFSPAFTLWRLGRSLLGAERAFTLLTPGLLAFAGWCTYGYLRQLGASPAAGLLAALVLAFNELMLETLGTIGVPGTVAFLPLALWLGEGHARRGGLPLAAATGLALGAALLGGHQQYALFGGLLVCVVLLVRNLQERGLAALPELALALSIAAGLSAVAVLPGLELLGQAKRGDVGLGALLDQEDLFLSADMLKGLASLSPDLRRGAAVELDPVYVGGLPLLLALVGLADRPRRGTAWTLGAVALGALLLSLRATGLLPLLLGSGLPGLWLLETAEGRLLVLLIATALLAGLGLDRLQLLVRRWSWGPRLVAVLGVALVGLGLLRMRADLQRDVFDELVVDRAQLAALVRAPVGLGTRPSLDAGSRFYLHPDRSREELENTALLLGGSEASGRTVLPLRRYLEFLHARTDLPALEQRAPEDPADGFLAWPALVELAALDRVMLPERFADFRPAGSGWRRLGAQDGRVGWMRTRALVRARVVGSARVLPDRQAVLEELKSPDADLDAAVLLEAADGPAELSGSQDAGRGRGTVRVVDYDANRASYQVQTDGPAWLLIQDAWYPGWQATVDGQPAVLRRADFVARAVPLAEAGSHTVELRFAPASLRRGAWLSGAALVLALALLLTGLRRRRAA